jgi:hypothetical protein
MPTPLDALVAATQDRLAVLGQRRALGMATAEWRLEVQNVLKQAHIAAAALGVGGWDALDRGTTGLVGSRLRGQYDYLAQFALQVPGGDTFGPQALARLAQYGEGAVRGTASAVARRGAAAGSQERNISRGSVRACDQCQGLSALGLVPLGTLPEVGTRTCAGNCRCVIEIVPPGEAA